MIRLVRYVYNHLSPANEIPGDEKLHYQFGIFTLAGVFISLFLLLYKEAFRADLANPVAETGTLLLFVFAFYLFLRNKSHVALNLVFLIPGLAYFYYLADFSNIPPLNETIYFTMAWFAGGLILLGWFSSVNIRFTLLFILGVITLTFHIVSAGMSGQFFSLRQIFLFNPYLILLFFYGLVVMTRKNRDENYRLLEDKERAQMQRFQDLFQDTRIPLALINVLRDHEGNILSMTVGKINHAFESGFRITMPEAKDQELNTLFNFLFRNNADWNDFLILNPRKQVDFFSPVHERWFNLHFLWTDSDSCLCVFYDISREKKTILKLEETRARYLALLEAIPDIFFVIDSDGIFQDAVFKGQEMMTMEIKEIIGNSIFSSGFSELMATRVQTCIKNAIENDTIETIEYTLDVKGNSLLFEMRLARIDDSSVIAIARDITTRKKAEFELARAKTRADEANALKSRFLANLSDDIRTPVGIILSMTKMLSETDLSDISRQQIIRDVELQGTSLLNMIENTIFLSRIETNTLEVNPGYINIHQMLKRLYRELSLQLPADSEVNLLLETGIHHDEVGFDSDPALLYESLSRLVENALKFTVRGSVRFGYYPKGNMVGFYVADDGPGIPASEKENVFLRFYVIESDRKARKSGLGLGLPIAQHFVALLGGELKLDSAPGRGSRFWFELPLKNPRGFMRIINS